MMDSLALHSPTRCWLPTHRGLQSRLLGRPKHFPHMAQHALDRGRRKQSLLAPYQGAGLCRWKSRCWAKKVLTTLEAFLKLIQFAEGCFLVVGLPQGAELAPIGQGSTHRTLPGVEPLEDVEVSSRWRLIIKRKPDPADDHQDCRQPKYKGRVTGNAVAWFSRVIFSFCHIFKDWCIF